MAWQHRERAQGHLGFTVVQHRPVHFPVLTSGGSPRVGPRRVSGKRQGAIYTIALHHRFGISNADGFGDEPAESFQSRAHGAVPGPGCRKGTVKIDVDTAHPIQQVRVDQLGNKTVGGAHRPHCVRT